MNSSHWFRLAALASGLTVAVILALVMPVAAWTPGGIVAALALVLSLGGVTLVLLPAPATQRNATGIWLIGPAGMWTAALIVVALAAFLTAVFGLAVLCWVLVTLWIGALVVGWTFLRAATNVVASAAGQTSSASLDARTGWLIVLRSASASTSGPSRAVLDRVADRVQYAATSSASSASDDRAIDVAVNDLVGAASDHEELLRRSLLVERLLTERELTLRASRTRA